MVFRLLILLLLVSSIGCGSSQQEVLNRMRKSGCGSDTSVISTDTVYKSGQMAVLGSRFQSFDELKSVVHVEYFSNGSGPDSSNNKNNMVCLRHCSNGREVVGVLRPGVSQTDIGEARNGSFWDRLNILVRSPYAVGKRAELSKVYDLSRRRTDLYGEGDPSFYDLAIATFKNINTEDLAFLTDRDTSEKGYLNTFNHFTAQALVTSCFSTKLADFVGQAHERAFHPELITGEFPAKEIKDLGEGPVDNYVDLVNNEWGEEFGEVLKKKYHITRKTYWTPELLSDYLNDLQNYYGWAFQIGFKPFKPDDELVIRFSKKMNIVLNKSFNLSKT